MPRRPQTGGGSRRLNLIAAMMAAHREDGGALVRVADGVLYAAILPSGREVARCERPYEAVGVALATAKIRREAVTVLRLEDGKAVVRFAVATPGGVKWTT